jgi:hypothetical protein
MTIFGRAGSVILERKKEDGCVLLLARKGEQ